MTYADIDGRTTGVLWEQVLPPPFWLWPERAVPIGKVHPVGWLGGLEAEAFQAALEVFLTQRELQHMTPDQIGKVHPATEVATGADVESDAAGAAYPTGDGILATLARQMVDQGIDADVVAGTLAAVTGRQDETTRPAQADVQTSPSGYILPGGAFYAATWSIGHWPGGSFGGRTSKRSKTRRSWPTSAAGSGYKRAQLAASTCRAPGTPRMRKP